MVDKREVINVLKQYLKRRKLLQEQFERLMRELEEKDFFPGEQRKDFVDMALSIDRRLFILHPVLIFTVACIVVYLMHGFSVKLK